MAGGEDSEEVRDALGAMYEAGAAAWPGVLLEASVFEAFVGRSFEGGTEEGLRALHGADLYLAAACERGDEGAVRALRERYFPELDRALAQLRLDEEQAAEARQSFVEKLLVGSAPAIGGYAGRGDLGSWLRVSMVRHALSSLRKEARERRRVVATDVWGSLAAAGTDPELAAVKAHHGEAFNRLFPEAVRALEPQERTFLRHQYVDMLTVDQLAALYGFSPRTAARRLHDARDALLSKLRALMCEELGVEDRELDSLLALIASRIDISIQAVLVD